MSDMAVDARGLVKRYGSLTAVDAVDLRVGVGEVYGLLGPNGAGETMFLRMLLGLVRPDAGTLEVLDRTWATDGSRALDGVAGCLESPRFYPNLSGRRNLELLSRLDGGGRGRVDEVLTTVELTGRDRDEVKTYSFGMRPLLGVAAALLPAFTELHLQQADILGHTQVTRTSMAATDTCDKGGPKLPDEGVGPDWICMIQWTDDQGVRQDGKVELQVHSNSCYTATGPSRITGTVMIPDLHGVDVPNPVFEFGGCFDPDAAASDRPAATT